MAAPSTPFAATTTLEADERFMGAAVAMGYRNLGQTWPNPSVGAVLVRQTDDGPLIVSAGVTSHGGRPHAERLVLAEAGAQAQNATLYVTLEPCCHTGHTPPCTDAIIAAGVGRVVAGILDPDPRVSGLGFARLRDAGIAVTTGVLESQARFLHRGHLRRVVAGRPATTVKLAQTRDGYAAGAKDAQRLFITGQAADARTHMMRAHADAILIGVSTANADNPRLDVRLPGLETRSPVRVVFDSDLSIDPGLRLHQTAATAPTWVVTAVDASLEREAVLRDRGVEVMRVERSDDGRIDVRAAMALLAVHGLSTVLCDGGPTLADALVRHDLVDEMVVITAPEALGAEGLPALSPLLRQSLESRYRLREVERAGRDEFAFYERAE